MAESGDVWGARRNAAAIVASDDPDAEAAVGFLERTGIPKQAFWFAGVWLSLVTILLALAISRS